MKHLSESLRWLPAATLLFLWFLRLADSVTSTVSPPMDQYIPVTSTDNVTYTCTVESGSSVIWSIQGAQISTGNIAQYEAIGIFVRVALPLRLSSTVVITRNARDSYSQQTISVECIAFLPGPPPRGEVGPTYFIIPYGPPDPPSVVQIVPRQSGLFLEWPRVESNVSLHYNLEITSTRGNLGPFVTSGTSYSIHFLEEQQMNDTCMMFEFSVRAVNDAGSGAPRTIVETVPLSTDVANISQSLRIDSVDLQNGTGVRVQVSFQALNSCSINFPVLTYIISLVATTQSVTIPASTATRNGDRIVATLSQSDISGLIPNALHSVTVTACSEVSCSESDARPFYTTDVMNVVIYFFENNIFVECSFAANSVSRGCVVLLVVNGNETRTDELRLERSSNALSTITQCNTTTYQMITYDVILGLDWESNGTVGSIPVPITVNPIEDVGNFTEMTNCVIPVEGASNTVRVVVPIVVVLLTLTVVIVIVILVVFYHYRRPRLTLSGRGELHSEILANNDVLYSSVPTLETDGDDSESGGRDEVDGGRMDTPPPIQVILKNNCILVNVNKEVLSKRANKICRENRPKSDRTPLMATVEISDELEKWIRAR